VERELKYETAVLQQVKTKATKRMKKRITYGLEDGRKTKVENNDIIRFRFAHNDDT